MAFVKAGLIIVVFAAAAAQLAWLGRRVPGPWAILGALLLGPRDSQRVGVDLRFASLAAGTAVLLLVVLAFPTVFRALAPGELAFALALGFPFLATGLAAAGDLWRRVGPESLRSEPASEGEGLSTLLADARGEVETAMTQVEDPGRIAALEALTEAVSEYDLVIRDRNGETARHLRKSLDQRIRGVITLARSCVDEERRQASQVLGVREGATQDEIGEVFAALTRTYSELSGADATKLVELTAAYESLMRPAPGRAAA